MADGFELLAAYIKLSIPNYKDVVSKLKSLKDLVGELKGGINLNPDTTALDAAVKKLATGQDQKLKPPKVGVVKPELTGDAAASALLGFDIARATQRAQKAVSTVRAVLSDSAVQREPQVVTGVTKSIRAFETRAQAIRSNIALFLKLNNIPVAQGLVTQLQEETRAFQKKLFVTAKVLGDEARLQRTYADRIRQADAFRTAQDKVNAVIISGTARASRATAEAAAARAKADRLTVESARNTLFFNQQITTAERALLVAKIQTTRGITNLNRVFTSDDRAQTVSRQTEINRRIKLADAARIAEERSIRAQIKSADAFRSAYQKMVNDQIKAADAFRSAQEKTARQIETGQRKIFSFLSSSAGSNAFAGLGRGLLKITTLVTNVAKIPVSSSGFLGKLGGLARSVSGLVPGLKVAGAVMLGLGAITRLVGGAFNLLLGVFSAVGNALSAVISVIGSVISAIGQVIGAVFKFAGALVNLAIGPLKFVAGAVLKIVFPLISLWNILGNVQRRLLPFIASFIAFKGLSAIADDIRDFESNIAKAAANTAESARDFGKSFGALRAQAGEIARTTSFSITEIARTLTELSKAGFKAAEAGIVAKDALNLSRIGGKELEGDAAVTLIVQALGAFNLTAADSTNVTNALLSATKQSIIGFEDTAKALSLTGVTAQKYGIEIETITSLLVRLGDAGIKGSKAATAINQGLGRLIKPARAVQDALEEVLASQGVNIFEFFTPGGELKDGTNSLFGLIDAMAKARKESKLTNVQINTIFGDYGKQFGILLDDSIDQTTGQLLSAKEKLIKVRDQIKKDQVSDLSGNTADFLSGTFDGLAEKIRGQFEQLGLAISDALGPRAKEVMIGFVGAFQTVIDGINELGSVQDSIRLAASAFGELYNYLSPLIGVILRLNTVALVGIILTLGKLAMIVGSRLNKALGWAIDKVAEFSQVPLREVLGSWSGTILFIEKLIRNFGLYWEIGMNTIKIAGIEAARFILSTFAYAIQSILNFLRSSELQNPFSGLLDGIAEIGGQIVTTMVEMFATVGSYIIDKAIPYMASLGGLWGLEMIGTFGIQVLRAVPRLIEKVAELFGITRIPGFPSVFELLVDAADKGQAEFTAHMGLTGDIMRAQFAETGKELTEDLGKTLTGIDVSGLGRSVTTGVQNAVTGANLSLQTIKAKIDADTTKLQSGIKDVDPRGVAHTSDLITKEKENAKLLEKLYKSADDIEAGKREAATNATLEAMKTQNQEFYRQQLSNGLRQTQATEAITTGLG